MITMGWLRKIGLGMGVLILVLAQAQAEVELDHRLQQLSIVAMGERLDEDHGPLPVSAAVDAPGWRPTAHQSLLLSPQHNSRWFHVRLYNRDTLSLPWVLEAYDAHGVHQLDMVLLDDQGRWITGLNTAHSWTSAHLLGGRNPALALALQSHQHADLYVHFKSSDTLYHSIPLLLWSTQAFAQHIRHEDIQYGLYYGVLVALILYNLFLFLSLRDSVFAWYGSYVFCLLLWNLILRGYAHTLLGLPNPALDTTLLAIWVQVALLVFIRFSLRYLDVGPEQRSARRACFWLSLLCLLDILPTLYGDLLLSFQIGLPLLLLCIPMFTLLALQAWRKGRHEALFYLVSCAVLLIGLSLQQMSWTGWLEHTLRIDTVLQLSSVLAMLLLGLGLALRLKPRNTLATQLAAPEAILADSELARLIRERDDELERSRQMLTHLGITDELTGAYNLRHFREVLRQECHRRRRSKQSLTLCLINLDDFSGYNAEQGRAAGDDALVQVAETLRRHLRRSGDRLFRLDGDNFAALLELDSGPKSRDYAQTLRQAIHELQLTYTGSPGHVLSASFGVLHLSGNASAMEMEELYAATDALLYLAKARGRDCIEVQWR